MSTITNFENFLLSNNILRQRTYWWQAKVNCTSLTVIMIQSTYVVVLWPRPAYKCWSKTWKHLFLRIFPGTCPSLQCQLPTEYSFHLEILKNITFRHPGRISLLSCIDHTFESDDMWQTTLFIIILSLRIYFIAKS